MSGEVLRRRAARVILVDEDGRVLLFRGSDPARPEAGTWWFTTGGGLEPGESVEDAARREVFEETGFRLGELGPVVHESSVQFSFAGTQFDQHQSFFVVTTSSFEVDVSGWDDVEVASIAEHRWWPVEELRTTTERVYPENLLDLLAR
jgi:8-oxo-dGTP pyrophosphatase MutT (NUDIX family)